MKVPKEIMECSSDRGVLPEYFNINVGLDFKLKTRPELYAKVNNPRTVKIILTTFRGLSWDAVHYYSKIEADGIYIVDPETNYSIGGYICEEYKNLPKEKDAIWSWKYEIEVERYITQQELDENPNRWRGYELGWTTNAFYTKEDALAQALKIVEARFSPEWTVEIDDRTE